MKTKEEILEMSKEELESYKWNDDLNAEEEKKDTNFDCYNCSNCLYCRNLRDKIESYYICNVEVTKEEFEKKKKEIGGKK